jgi:glutamate-1-semialdehyde 2,1-aminomutase
MIFSLNFTDDDMASVEQRFVAAALEMQADGWWYDDPEQSNKSIRRSVLKEMLRQRF